MSLWTITCCQFALVLIFIWVEPVWGKGQYVMPILGGMKMNLSYDISNIFIRPIASFITVGLSIAMLFILGAGVVTSPFGYMFGIPSRKYVLGSESVPTHQLQVAPRSLDGAFTNTSSHFLGNMPSFDDQVFYLIPSEIQTPDCRLLALCHAHNIVTKLPPSILELVRFFSKRLIELSEDHRRAILKGIAFQEDCTETYNACKESGYTVVIKTILYWLPAPFKNHDHRRKKAMYMKSRKRQHI